jgi:hypothetical protein
VQERYSDHFWRDPSAQSASSKRGGRRSSATKSTALGIERYAANGAVNDTTTRVKAGEKKSSLQSSGMASPISRAKTDVLDKNKARLPSARILSQRIATLQEVLEQEELVGAGAAGGGPDDSSLALSLFLELASEAVISPRRAGTPVTPAEQAFVRGLTPLMLQRVTSLPVEITRVQPPFTRAERAIVVELLLVLNIHAQVQPRKKTILELLGRAWRLLPGGWQNVIDFAMDRGYMEDALIVIDYAASQDTGKLTRYLKNMRNQAIKGVSWGPPKASEPSENTESAARSIGDVFESEFDRAVRQRDVASARALIQRAVSSALHHQDWATARNVIIEAAAVDPGSKPHIDDSLPSEILISLTEQEAQKFLKMTRRFSRRSRTDMQMLEPFLRKAKKSRRSLQQALQHGNFGTLIPQSEASLFERTRGAVGEERSAEEAKQEMDRRNDFPRGPATSTLPSSDTASMVQWMQEAPNLGSKGDRPQSVMYALQIRRATLWQQDFSAAERLLESMIQQGCRPDQAHITPFIEALCALGRRSDAVRVRNDALQKLGIHPSVRARAAIVAVHVLLGRASHAQQEMEEMLLAIGKEGDLSEAPLGSNDAEQAFRLIQEFAERWNKKEGIHVALSEDQLFLLQRLYARFNANSGAGLATTALVQKTFTEMLRKYDYLRAERYLARALATGLQPDKELYQRSKRSGMHIRKFVKQLQSSSAARHVTHGDAAVARGRDLQDPAMITMTKMMQEAEGNDDAPDDPVKKSWTDGDINLAQVLLAAETALDLHQANRKKMRLIFNEQQAREKMRLSAQRAREERKRLYLEWQQTRERRQLPARKFRPQVLGHDASISQLSGVGEGNAEETREEARRRRRSMLSLLFDWVDGTLSSADSARRRQRGLR